MRTSGRAGPRRAGSTAAGALAGMLAGAVALGVAELAAAITGPQGAPVIAVGEVAISLTPVPVKEFAIAHFGSHDKDALVTGILVLLAAFAAVIGMLAVRRIAFGLAGLAVFAGVGATASVTAPDATALDVVPTLAGTCVAAAALAVLVRGAWAALPRVGGDRRPARGTTRGVAGAWLVTSGPQVPIRQAWSFYRARIRRRGQIVAVS